ncbi:hypothetical protein lerEdw1_006384 [Lerista edwardsae]|nr:hypothetical protein lerEdw1_006384 [Lerista edwardsae]
MLPRSTARPRLVLALLALWARAEAAPLPDLCEQEVNKIKDLLQVSCVGKGLAAVPVGLPPGTGILLLSSNRLERVSLAVFQGLANLTDLDLANNSLAAVESASTPLPALQQLSLAHNALGSLPALPGLPRLQRLALGHNALAQLPEGGFRALRRLQDLELQGNRLRRLLPGTFAGLEDLRDLDLSDNALEELPRALLAGLGALQILRLERNRLRAVPEGFFQDNGFAYVYLSGNPWRCDCRLQYLRDWIVENELSVYTRVQGPGRETTEPDPESVACQAPPGQKGRPVMHFQAACREPGDGLPVRALPAHARPQAPAPWAGHRSLRCCPLRLALHVACLALVALPTLAVCCWGWGGLCRPLPAARGQQRQTAVSTSGGLGTRAGPRLYHVCKEFQVAQSSHVTWLLVSLPGPAGQRPCERGLLGEGRGAASAL